MSNFAKMCIRDRLFITTLELDLPKQGCWEGVGLTPDIQLENRKVTVNTKNLKSLDTSTTLRFGDSSDAVYAMTERLSLLGLLTEATGRYDGDVADAVASFRAAYDLPAALYASPEMLSALDEAVTALNGQTYLVDDQLQSALETVSYTHLDVYKRQPLTPSTRTKARVCTFRHISPRSRLRPSVRTLSAFIPHSAAAACPAWTFS